MQVIYRGYQGHFIGQCRFHLNTLIDFEDSEIENIIVSTIGAFVVDEKEQRLGLSDNDFYETSVFHTEIGYWDIDGEMTPFEDIDPSDEIQRVHTPNEVLAHDKHMELLHKYIKQIYS